ncbi:DUF823 domain-containing adhesin [Photobacterium sp. SDRW27]|uniref:SPOR domain-containing protein n=1 Tax=Photobacterium obscurum TaxID=2829490 RepID=UPI002242E506|nr:SPOR domain-containing protein [Photobacterium obscurum]MCW8327706.1 DUF823 domain-containing adhesin [Photobacterium obscurum]
MNCKNKQLLSFWLLLPLASLLSQTSHAEEQGSTTCQVEKTVSGWKLLNSQCDIGNGLWGRKPKNIPSSFWLQCNYGKALPNKELTAQLSRFYHEESYLVPDNGKLRCLIGPFQNYNQAKTAKNQLNSQKLKNTFIRQTTSVVSINNRTSGYARTDTSSTSAQSPAATQQKKKLVDNRVIMNSIIYSFTFNNLSYHLPKNINSTKEMPPAFTQENNQYWSKVNFLPAENWCKKYGLRLPTAAELKELQTYGQYLLLRHKWPIKSSYWSNTINPYTGEIKTLNLRNGQDDEYRPLAQLYVTCVTEAS